MNHDKGKVFLIAKGTNLKNEKKKAKKQKTKIK